MNTSVRAKTFTPIDATWLNFELSVSHSLIVALLLFNEPADFER